MRNRTTQFQLGHTTKKIRAWDAMKIEVETQFISILVWPTTKLKIAIRSSKLRSPKLIHTVSISPQTQIRLNWCFHPESGKQS